MAQRMWQGPQQHVSTLRSITLPRSVTLSLAAPMWAIIWAGQSIPSQLSRSFLPSGCCAGETQGDAIDTPAMLHIHAELHIHAASVYHFLATQMRPSIYPKNLQAA